MWSTSRAGHINFPTAIFTDTNYWWGPLGSNLVNVSVAKNIKNSKQKLVMIATSWRGYQQPMTRSCYLGGSTDGCMSQGHCNHFQFLTADCNLLGASSLFLSSWYNALYQILLSTLSWVSNPVYWNFVSHSQRLTRVPDRCAHEIKDTLSMKRHGRGNVKNLIDGIDDSGILKEPAIWWWWFQSWHHQKNSGIIYTEMA